MSDAVRGSALAWLAMTSDAVECAARTIGATVMAMITFSNCGDLTTTLGVGISGAMKTNRKPASASIVARMESFRVMRMILPKRAAMPIRKS